MVVRPGTFGAPTRVFAARQVQPQSQQTTTPQATESKSQPIQVQQKSAEQQRLEKVLLQLQREAEGKRGTILDTKEERLLREKLINSDPDIRRAIEAGSRFRLAKVAGIKIDPKAIERQIAKDPNFVGSTLTGFLIRDPTTGKIVEVSGRPTGPVQAGSTLSFGQKAAPSTESEEIAKQSLPSGQREVFFTPIPNKDIRQIQAINQISSSLADKLASSVTRGREFLGRLPYLTTKQGRQELTIRETEKAILKNRSSQIDSFNKEVEKFNDKYGDRELSQSEIDKAQKELNALKVKEAKLAIEEQQFQIFEQNIQGLRGSRTLPEKVTLSFQKGVAASLQVPAVLFDAGFTALNGDFSAIQNIVSALPVEQAITEEQFKERREKLNQEITGFVNSPFEKTATFAGFTLLPAVTGAVSAQLKEPFVTKIGKTKIKFISEEVIQPLSIGDKQLESTSFLLRAETPAQLGLLDTRANLIKRNVGKVLQGAPPPLKNIGDKFVKDAAQKVIVLRKAEQRNTLGDIITSQGEILRGVTGTRRKGATLTDVATLTGRQESFNILDIEKLTKLQKFTLKKGLAKDTGAIGTKNIEFFKGGLESERRFRFIELKGDKGFELTFFPKKGRVTNRRLTISALRELPEIKIQDLDIIESALALKDVTRSAPKAAGGIDIIKGRSFIREPIIKDSEGFNLGAEKPLFSFEIDKPQISKKALKQATANVKAIELSEAKAIIQKVKAATSSALSRARTKALKAAEISRVQNLPILVGGSGKGISDFANQESLVLIENDISGQPSPISKQTPLTEINVKTSIFPVEKTSEINVVKFIQKPISKSVNKEANKGITKEVTKEAIKEVTKEVEKTAQKELLKLAQKEALKQVNKRVSPNQLIGPRSNIKPLKTPKFFGFGLRKAKNKAKIGSGFNVLIRRKGKEKIVASDLPKNIAKQVGANLARKSLARTFRIKPTGRKARLADIEAANLIGFRRPKKKSKLPKESFVEESKFSLNTPTEIGEIIKARKRKRK